jgi:hypothetical protein
MLTINTTIQAGQTVKFTDQGNFLRVMSAVAALTVRTYQTGRVLTESVGVGAGYAEEFSEAFDAVEIYSATTQAIQLVMRLGSKVYFDAPPTGNVNITNSNGAFTQSRSSVSNTNVQILPINTNRRYLLLQNNDPVQALRISIDGTPATATSGFRLEAGNTFEIPNYCVTNAINVIFEIATTQTNNVEFVTG